MSDRAAPPGIHLGPLVIEELADRLSEVIAERVVEAMRAELIVSPGATATAWLDAKEVAERLGVDRDWVYEHADELGASRLGSGPRPRLRFPPDVFDSRRGDATSKAARQPTEPRSKATGLIPIRGS